MGKKKNVDSSQKVSITIKSYNCYIKFSGFREYFDICLYKSGDIDIKMRESCHADYLERIYEYKEDRAQQEAFLEKLKDGFAMQDHGCSELLINRLSQLYGYAPRRMALQRCI